MLFKTRDPENNGIYYCSLPKDYRFKILEEDTIFDRDSCIILRDPSLPYSTLSKEMMTKLRDDDLVISSGTKHLYFYDYSGRATNIFFHENGWLIEEKGKTVETL